MAYFRPFRDESLTFGQTTHLRLEISLIYIFAHGNYVILLLALESLCPICSYKAKFSLIGAESLT